MKQINNLPDNTVQNISNKNGYLTREKNRWNSEDFNKELEN